MWTSGDVYCDPVRYGNRWHRASNRRASARACVVWAQGASASERASTHTHPAAWPKSRRTHHSTRGGIGSSSSTWGVRRPVVARRSLPSVAGKPGGVFPPRALSCATSEARSATRWRSFLASRSLRPDGLPQGPGRLLEPRSTVSLPGTCGLSPPRVKGGEKPDQRAKQNTATAAVGVRWSEGVGIRLWAAGAGNAGRA